MHFERQNYTFFQEKKCVPTLPKIFRPITRNTLILFFGLFLCPESVVCFSTSAADIQVHFRLDCFMEALKLNPDQTAPKGRIVCNIGYLRTLS